MCKLREHNPSKIYLVNRNIELKIHQLAQMNT